MKEKVVSANELQFIGEDDENLYLSGEDTPFTGKVEGFYENGQKEAEVNYKDGKKNGIETWWYWNGQKSWEGNLKDGKEDGLFSWWYESGVKEFEGNYKDGKLMSAEVWKPNG
ncbi:toxin-antitoxin system YwqK family antitoxin, partial [Verrucomicrobia bacterium]|nr:toxin-antitoxin system YwqK family antitoxin [Verrucomicrobiota bacterium]